MMLKKQALVLVLALFGGGLAAAAESAPMVVAVDHAELLRLPAAAEKVIVGNPALADVTVDSPKLISVFGKQAGETNLIVLGAKDQMLVSRPLIVIRGADHAVAVHVPGRDGPSERLYECAEGRCQRVKASDDKGGGAAPAASPPAPAH
jgi:hypothetical protein